MANPENHPITLEATRDTDSLVCVVDDDVECRRSLERLLRSRGLKAESFADGDEYLSRPPHAGPLCLVLDIRFPGGRDGYDIQRCLTLRGEQIVFLTGFGDVPSCARAMKAGAVDFLLKPVDPDAFLVAVRQALARSAARLRENQLAHDARMKLATLTPRETEVFERVVAGWLNKQIAADLGAAEKTIKTHRGRVMHKTACASVPELVRLARRAGRLRDESPG